jgi:hypothetical protein
VLATKCLQDFVADVARIESGVLPDPGGWHDQPATFVAACPLAQQEISDWREKHAELARQRANKQR